MTNLQLKTQKTGCSIVCDKKQENDSTILFRHIIRPKAFANVKKIEIYIYLS